MPRNANSAVPSGPISFPRIFRGEHMRVVSVTGGKGGVGKSSIAVNLALGLGALGGRVLVVDGDLGLANADQLLGVQASATMWDVVQGRIPIEDAAIATRFGVSLLPACSGRQEMVELTPGARADLVGAIRGLAGSYDFVVIDTAAGIGETALGLAQAGDVVLAVATPDPTSARDAFSIMKILAKERGIRRIELVANMVSTERDGEELFRRLSSVTCKFLPLALGFAGAIVRDPCMARAVVERTPALAAFPTSLAAKQIAKLAAHVVALDRELGAAAPETESGSDDA
jgi:flagellar biosynthesis protein FlhG